MKRGLLIVVAMAIASLSGLEGCSESREARGRRLSKQFAACVPDSLPEKHHREIAGLLDTFWKRVEMDEVYEEDVVKIETKLQSYVDAGWIDIDTLAHFMALVGYSSYRKDPRYNLPERIVDHPTLNPDAAIVFFGADTSGPRARIYYKVPEVDSTADTTKTDTTKAPPK
jgi:hypothetical protein